MTHFAHSLRHIMFLAGLYICFLSYAQTSYYPTAPANIHYPHQHIRQMEQFYTKSVHQLDSTVTYSPQNNRLQRVAYQYSLEKNLEDKTAYRFENNQWTTTGKTSYQYDSQKNIINERGYLFDNQTQTFTLIYETAFEYDDKNNITKETHNYYDDVSKQMCGDVQYQKKYDNNGNPLEVVVSVWNRNKKNWQFSQKFIYAYDSSDKQTIAEEYIYDETTSEWAKLTRSVQTYDANGNTTLQEYAVGDPNVNTWKKYSKIESQYINQKINGETIYNADDNGNLKKLAHATFSYLPSGKVGNVVTSQFDKNTNTWNEAFQYTYAYDAANNLRSIMHAIKKNPSSSWITIYKNTYNVKNSPHKIQTESSIKTADEKWIGNIKKLTTFDNKSRLNGVETYFWNNDKWQPSSKDVAEYDANDQLYSVAKYSGSIQSPNVWEGYYKSVFQYEKQKDIYAIKKDTRYSWQSGEWSERNHTIYYYSDRSETSIEPHTMSAKIYWSPDQTIRIETNNDVESIAVFNLIGKQIYQARGNSSPISTASWSKGVYAVKVLFKDHTLRTEKIYVR